MFKRHLRVVFDEKHSADSAPLKEVIALIQKKASGQEFSRSEIDAAIDRLGDDNAAMVADDNLVLI